MQGITSSRLGRGCVALLATGAASLAFGVASASAAKNLVKNGSFETGSFSSWTTTNPASLDTCSPHTVAWTVELSPSSNFCFAGMYGCPASISAVQGSYFADVTWDGGGAPTDATLSQKLSIPKDSKAKLHWSDNTCWDTMFGATLARVEYLDVLNASGSTILHSYTIQTLAPNSTGNTGWVMRTVNMTKYAGKTVQIRFRLTIPQTFKGPGNFAIDAIALHATKH